MTAAELLAVGRTAEAFDRINTLWDEDPKTAFNGGPYVSHYPRRHACKCTREGHCLVCGLPEEVHG
jgi:hypothetical protein